MQQEEMWFKMTIKRNNNKACIDVRRCIFKERLLLVGLCFSAHVWTSLDNALFDPAKNVRSCIHELKFQNIIN